MKLSWSSLRFGASLATHAACGLTALLALNLGGAHAAEVVWDGHYRTSGFYFDSLSLISEADSAFSEGSAGWLDHRLRLQPGFLMSDKVAIYTQVDLLPYVRYGEDPVDVVDPISGTTSPYVYSDAVGAPLTEEGGVTSQNLRVTRAWGEVQTRYGQLRFGRMPVEWGTGMVFNAGNDVEDDFGDTSDRIQFTGKVKKVYVMGAFENRYEGLLAEPDDYRALVTAVYYKGERSGAGTYHTLRRRSLTDDAGAESTYYNWIGDVWAGTNLGPLKADLELAGSIGNGDLEDGINDLKSSSFGGVLAADYAPGRLAGVNVLLTAGFATGDAIDDGEQHTFAFDPDYDLGIMLFEESMPSFEPEVTNDANQGRTTEAARSGNTVSNALFLKVGGGYQFLPSLRGEVTALMATQAKATDTTGKGYGTELDATVKWAPYAHFDLKATGALFLPGKYFTEFESDEYGTGFDGPAVGSKLTAAIRF